MGRKSGELDSNRWTFFFLLLMGIASCALVYMSLSSAPRPSANLSSDLQIIDVAASFEGDRDEDCCRGVEHLELWGSVVKWGTDFKFNSSTECCHACKSMCGGSEGPCLCDSWVFCGNREKCGTKFGECWLKKQQDSMIPSKHDEGENVMWTSGLIFGKGEGIIGLETEYGIFHIKLFPDCAPYSVAYIIELLGARHCAGCQFYRAEGRGTSWDSEGKHISNAPHGPPFALIQGTLEAEGIPFPGIKKESCPYIRRGAVAWVGNGPDFFISLANHDEWRKSYTVFGYVLPEDMEIAEKIAALPTRSDVWSDIPVSVLAKPVPLWFRRITKAKITQTKVQIQTISVLGS